MRKATRKDRRILRHRRVFARVKGSATKPRLSVFRSHTHLYVQLIDDTKSKVLAAASGLKTNAKEIGRAIAQKAKERKIENIVFDRSGYKYHGHLKVLAEEMRAQGMIF